jgi:undecaprenyl-diphosphatase
VTGAGRRVGLLAGAGAVIALVVVPLAVLVRDGWGPLRSADARWVHSVALTRGWARDVVLAVTQLGAPLLLEAAALVMAAVLFRSRRRLALYVLVSVFGAELLSTISKHVVARVRPCADAVSGCPHNASFPSGHAVGAAAFWTAVAVLLLPRLGRKAWLLAVGVPLVVAVTRVLLGVHYPSDVVAGLLMGWCWTAATTAVFATWRDERAGRDVPLEEGLE